MIITPRASPFLFPIIEIFVYRRVKRCYMDIMHGLGCIVVAGMSKYALLPFLISPLWSKDLELYCKTNGTAA